MIENVIEIYLDKKEDYKNKYNNNRLSNELSNYILEESKNKILKQKIILEINTKFVLSDEEKEKLIDMIRNNYGTDVSEIMNISKKERLINIVILLTGILFLVLYFLISKVIFLSELTLILGWVFIGEAICNETYHNIENKIKILRRKQITEAKIIFK